MSNEKPNVVARIFKAAKRKEQPITKADEPLAMNDDDNSSQLWISPAQDLKGYKIIADESTIIPQCRTAYKTNIAGFGISVQYKDDYDDETPEMEAEFIVVQNIVDRLNLDKDIKEVFEDLIELRETYGIAYLEAIRNNKGEVVQVELIKDVETIEKTCDLDPAVDITIHHNGEDIPYKKKFRKYRQRKNGKTVYFKEIGDPRVMDAITGEYVDGKQVQREANEILEFAIGVDTYGQPRWYGEILNVDGAKRAENLNNNYFRKGRHTPLAIIVNGGTLSDDSEAKLQEYIDGIEGEAGQHAFLLLEFQDNSEGTVLDEKNTPKVELKDLSPILQKDELFQEYIDNHRRKVQSAFRLPDLYVGYTQDYNRATANAAMEVTEQQVFIPERKSLAWQINNKLLADYHFKYCEVAFNGPDLSNVDDLSKILTVVQAAGGLTPNKAKDILYKLLGETSEDYEGEWGNLPLGVPGVSELPNATTVPGNADEIQVQIEESIQKALGNGENDIVAVLKEVKNALGDLVANGVVE